MPVCHALQELRRRQVHDEIRHAAHGIPKVVWIHRMLDENHGNASKCDQVTDVHSILKKVRWHYDSNIERKEDAWEL